MLKAQEVSEMAIEDAIKELLEQIYGCIKEVQETLNEPLVFHILCGQQAVFYVVRKLQFFYLSCLCYGEML